MPWATKLASGGPGASVNACDYYYYYYYYYH